MLYFMCAYYREYDAPHYFWREYYLPFMKNSTNFDFSKPMIVITRYDAGSKKNKYFTNFRHNMFMDVKMKNMPKKMTYNVDSFRSKEEKETFMNIPLVQLKKIHYPNYCGGKDALLYGFYYEEELKLSRLNSKTYYYCKEMWDILNKTKDTIKLSDVADKTSIMDKIVDLINDEDNRFTSNVLVRKTHYANVARVNFLGYKKGDTDDSCSLVGLVGWDFYNEDNSFGHNTFEVLEKRITTLKNKFLNSRQYFLYDSKLNKKDEKEEETNE